MSDDERPLAVSLMPLENRRDIIVHTAVRADELGFTSFILPETWGYDITVLLTEIAVRTERIAIGPGVLGVWGRTAGSIAMAIATLDEVSGGRAFLGLGASTPQLAEGLHDRAYNKPYSRLRTTVAQVKALLDGKRIPLATQTHARALSLAVSARADIPVLVGASNPKSIQLAAELADGWLPAYYPRSALANAVAELREAVAEDTPDKKTLIYPFLPTSVAADAATARTGAAWVVAFYLMRMGEVYHSTLRRLGYGAAVDAVFAANKGRRKPSLVPEEASVLLDELTVCGTFDSAPDKLDSWYAAGADMPILMLGPGHSRDEIDAILRAFRPG